MPSRSTDSKSRGSHPQGLDPASVHQLGEDLIGEDLHAKRVLSLASGVVGELHGATLVIHAIGEGIAGSGGQRDARSVAARRLRRVRRVGADSLLQSRNPLIQQSTQTIELFDVSEVTSSSSSTVSGRARTDGGRLASCSALTGGNLSRHVVTPRLLDEHRAPGNP